MSESLDDQIRQKFEGVADATLIRRIEGAEDFKHDDEEYELNRRLKLGGLAWRWTTIDSRERITVYPDVANMDEAQLILIMTEPGADEWLLTASEDEYFRRRAEVINRAQEDLQ